MTWTATTATFTVLGRNHTVLTPAFVIELYCDEAIHPHGRVLFDAIWQRFPTEKKYYVIGKNGTRYKDLTPRVLTRLRRTLENLATEGQFYFIKDAPGFAVDEYTLELRSGEQPPGMVHIGMPLSFVDTDPDAAVEFFRGLVDEFPFINGTAGYGFNFEWSREGEMKSMPVEIRAGRRFLGLNVRNRTQEGMLYRQFKTAHWLTFISTALLEELGGTATLETVLDDQVEQIPVKHGIVLRAGKTPPIGDVNRQAPDIEPLRKVNQLIRPLRIDEWYSGGMNLFAIDPDDANAWITRLDP